MLGAGWVPGLGAGTGCWAWVLGAPRTGERAEVEVQLSRRRALWPGQHDDGQWRWGTCQRSVWRR